MITKIKYTFIFLMIYIICSVNFIIKKQQTHNP